jgi:uncharacterized protein
MYRRFVLLVVLFSMSVLSLAYAGFDEGKAAYERDDYATALKEFKTAAERGNAEAQFLVGVMYANGEGVPQDYTEAAKWYRKAAEQGYADAQRELAELHKGVPGVPQDYAEVVKWYRKAAQQGDAFAQMGLGARYAHGEGVPQDFVQAYMWFDLAAANDLKLAQAIRDQVAASMTPAQIAEAQRLAREWKPQGKD